MKKGLSKDPQREQALRALRSVSLVVIFTVGSLLLTGGRFLRPHGNPFLYALAISWLVSYAVALLTAMSAAQPVFPLARWEQDGKIYERLGVGAFQWALVNSPLGWINPNLHLSARRADCDRLLRQMSLAEAVHWLTVIAATLLAVFYLVGGYTMYGFAMLLVRIPFDLYPIMLQRWNRGRVTRVVRRSKRSLVLGA